LHSLVLSKKEGDSVCCRKGNSDEGGLEYGEKGVEEGTKKLRGLRILERGLAQTMVSFRGKECRFV